MTDTTWTPQVSCKRALFVTHLRVYLEVLLIWQLFSRFEFKASISFRFVALQFSMYGSQTGLGVISITTNQKQERLDSYKEGFYMQTPKWLLHSIGQNSLIWLLLTTRNIVQLCPKGKELHFVNSQPVSVYHRVDISSLTA